MKYLLTREDVRAVIRTNLADDVQDITKLLDQAHTYLKSTGLSQHEINQHPLIKVLVFSLIRLAYGLPAESEDNFLRKACHEALGECWSLEAGLSLSKK
jgi:hypothetical protein